MKKFKDLPKKKRIIIIVAAIIVLVAIIVGIVVGVTKSNNSNKNNNEETTTCAQSQVVEVTDENGNVIGTTVIENASDTDTTNSNSKTDDSDTTKSDSKSETTTEWVTYYTTEQRNPLDPIETPDVPLDDYAHTESSAMYQLQNYYDSDKYVVNFDEANNDGDICAFCVFDKDDIYKIVYYVKVNLYTGEATETSASTGKTKSIDIPKYN